MENRKQYDGLPPIGTGRPISVFHFCFPFSYRLEESNGFGKSSRIGMTSVLPFKFARITGTSPQNSQINWRHAPQGGVRISVAVTTAMASKPPSPSLIAFNVAIPPPHS